MSVSNTLRKYPLSLALALTLSACAVGPDYQRPALATPTDLNQLPSAQALQGKGTATDWLHWWQSFDDAVLNALLDEAVKNNQDLVVAAARIEEARAQAVYANLNRLPGIDANVGASRAKTSQTTGRSAPGVRSINNDFLATLNVSYEVDFWGKYSRATEAARARLIAQEANFGTVQASLYASVAQAYFALRAYDAQVALAENTLKTRSENRRLQDKRFGAGSIGAQDLQQAIAEQAAAEVTFAQAKQNQQLVEATLALLLGRSPQAIAHPQIPRGKALSELYAKLTPPADLPSDVLNRRPDLRAAEQNLVAANAEIGQAKAQYFPSIKLTGGGGYESRVLSDLIQPSSLLWNLGANLAQPIFRGGLISALVDGAKARKDQALAQYVQAVQGAFRDVHDALVNMSADEQIVQASAQRQAALKETLRLANLRYDNGYSSYLEVLNAQRDLWQVESALIETQRAHLAATVSLYKALGGGWEVGQSR